MTTVRLKTRQLALLVNIMETGSLRQAAERIHLSQPAATRLLQELEEAVGAQLFERSRTGMQVTTAGHTMVEHARVLLAAMKDAFVSTQNAASGKIGALRIGVFGAADPECIATCILELKHQFPDVRVQIKEAPLEMLLSALENRDLDLVVSRVLDTDFGDTLNHEILYSDTFLLVCGEQHPLAHARAVQPDALFNSTWIIPSRETLARHHIDAYFAKAYGRAPPNTIESTSFLANIALLKQSDAVAVIAAQLAGFLIKQNVLKPLPLRIDGFNRPVAMISPKAQTPKPQVERMMALMRAYVRGNNVKTASSV